MKREERFINCTGYRRAVPGTDIRKDEAYGYDLALVWQKT
jgi:hypothetical protein